MVIKVPTVIDFNGLKRETYVFNFKSPLTSIKFFENNLKLMHFFQRCVNRRSRST